MRIVSVVMEPMRRMVQSTVVMSDLVQGMFAANAVYRFTYAQCAA